jgi:transposase
MTVATGRRTREPRPRGGAHRVPRLETLRRAAPDGRAPRLGTCSRASSSCWPAGSGSARLPRELGYGSGWTCWRRMREWAAAGVFERMHQAVLDRFGEAGGPDWSRAALDPVSVRAKEVAR